MRGRLEGKASGFVRGASGDERATTRAGSAACAQQPQVKQLGGQRSSPLAGNSSPLHGSSMASADTPETVEQRVPTTMAKKNRRTKVDSSIAPRRATALGPPATAYLVAPFARRYTSVMRLHCIALVVLLVATGTAAGQS